MTLLARVAFALLLAATGAAFFVAQRLKAEPSVINNFNRVEFFSPNGDGRRDVEQISFQLKERDDVTVDIVDTQNGRVRRIAVALAAQPFRPVRVTWDGRTDAGRRAPDGFYRVRIGLRRQARSVVVPQAIRLDTRPPSPAAIVDDDAHVVRPGAPVRFRIRGAGDRTPPSFQIIRTDVEPPETVRAFDGERRRRRYTWDGLTDGEKPASPGTYLISVTARDRAGNAGTGPPLPPEPGEVEGRPGVTVRALAVQPPVGPVVAGEPVQFLVDARRRSYRWQVRRVGEQRPRKRSRDRKTRATLQFDAPRGRSGVYLLEVRSGRYEARVPFAVQATTRAEVLVVLPTIAWLGRDRIDDPTNPDGIPNTLTNGTSAPFPRLFGGDEGLPAGFADGVAPLLAFLDRAGVEYDLTTDLALSRSRGPRATDRDGVLFVGSPTWVTRPLARRLRRYAADGGRVAIVGTNALRAGITLGRSRLTRPTQPAPTDALGARIASPRRVPELPDGQPAPLSTLDEQDAELGLLESFDGTFDFRFTSVEELISPGPRGQLIAGVGQALTDIELAEAEAANRTPREERPALTATRLGKGLVIRVGLQEWVPRLADGDVEVGQLTRNIVDILRRVKPKPRSPLR